VLFKNKNVYRTEVTKRKSNSKKGKEIILKIDSDKKGKSELEVE
jgi:hypothetical protein